MNNPFMAVSDLISQRVIQLYIILMVVAVGIGTIVDVYHKGSGKFFANRRHAAKQRAARPLGGIAVAWVSLRTIAEAAVSGEFHKWKRRVSHLLMMYGFIIYAVTTAMMAFADPGARDTPVVVPMLWDLGVLMVLGGGLWFFFFLRVNVAYDGDPPFHVGRADLFLLSLVGSAAFALLWHLVEWVSGTSIFAVVFFAIWLFFTTVLFISVPWSKFAHMFYKPVVAYQRKTEEADGSSDLPDPTRSRKRR